MLIYFALLFVAFLLYHFNKFSRTSAFIIMLLMFLVTGLRDISIGIDTERYLTEYHYMASDEKREPLFVLTIYLMKSIGASDNMWLLFVSSLIYLPYTYIILRYSKAPVMSALLFMTSSSLFFFDGMNGIRQWIASGFILLAFILKSKGELLKALIFLILAIGFHLSSIIVLPFLLIPGIRFNRSMAYFIIGASAILGLVFSNFNVSSMTDDYLNFISGYGGYGSEKLTDYANIGYVENTTNWRYYLLTILPISAICLVSFYDHSLNAGISSTPRRAGLFAVKQNEYYLYTIFLISIPLLNLASTTIAFGHRLAFAFVTTQLICLPEAYANCSVRQKKIIDVVMLYFMLFFIYYVFKNNGVRIGSPIPYKFFFE